MFLWFGALSHPISTGLKVLLAGGDWTSAVQATQDAAAVHISPTTGYLRNFFLRARTTGAGAGTVTGKVWVNVFPDYTAWVDTGIGISVSQNSNLESEDTSSEYLVTKGDLISVTLQNSVAGSTLWEEPSATIELVEVA